MTPTPPLAFGDYLAVYVPEDLPEIGEYYDQAQIYHETNTFEAVSSARGLLPPSITKLPSGKWEILGRFEDRLFSTRKAYIEAGGDPNQNPVILRRIN